MGPGKEILSQIADPSFTEEPLYLPLQPLRPLRKPSTNFATISERHKGDININIKINFG